ncbi:TetR/AcrR family transcriptional regulator [Streptomyces sp. FH025]|uniref:TetR/AcrR family transcriptional regulator n=1 Tax=Streptomyces sp. FH025 TaxID=2815937 RepID=UPI001A9D3709|nr:TetR/AcrR family transcriptional regulator [Streptomyces sp. FH025]MBO1417556.1 TetR/AcrR family transcriptional regulator C-terminal domain-containing protein [Streptomyces sp. FH025]
MPENETAAPEKTAAPGNETAAPADSAGTPAVTREALAQAALRILERDGLAGLSMRKVAAEVGVKAASLYWHVRNKEELLDLLNDAIMASAEPPPREGDWRVQLRDYCWRYRRLLNDNRDAVRIVAGRFAPGPHVFELLEDQLDRLRTAGFSNEHAALTSYLLSSFVQGFVLQEQSPMSAAHSGGASRLDVVTGVRDRFRALPVGVFPNLVELAGDLAEPNFDARFEFCVERILDGLAALLPPDRH